MGFVLGLGLVGLGGGGFDGGVGFWVFRGEEGGLGGILGGAGVVFGYLGVGFRVFFLGVWGVFF